MLVFTLIFVFAFTFAFKPVFMFNLLRLRLTFGGIGRLYFYLGIWFDNIKHSSKPGKFELKWICELYTSVIIISFVR